MRTEAFRQIKRNRWFILSSCVTNKFFRREEIFTIHVSVLPAWVCKNENSVYMALNCTRVNIFFVILDWKAEWVTSFWGKREMSAFIVLHFFFISQNLKYHLHHDCDFRVFLSLTHNSHIFIIIVNDMRVRGGKIFGGVCIKLNGFFLYYFRAIDFSWISF